MNATRRLLIVLRLADRRMTSCQWAGLSLGGWSCNYTLIASSAAGQHGLRLPAAVAAAAAAAAVPADGWRPAGPSGDRLSAAPGPADARAAAGRGRSGLLGPGPRRHLPWPLPVARGESFTR